MLIEIKNRKQIANSISKKILKEKISKVELSKKTELSRGSIYKILQVGGELKVQGYSIDILLAICKKLGVKIYLEY
jgi:DNA-binding Xre family transcriptional regulator